MTKKNILVTGTGGQSVGAGILHSLLRSNKSVAARWNVIAADACNFAWGLYKVPKSIILPFANDPQYISVLKKIISKYNIAAIVPGTQVEIEVFSNNLKEIGIPIIMNKKELVPLMMDKLKLQNRLLEFGVDFIETKPIVRWKEIVQKYGFPIVVKPRKDSGGSKGVCLVFDRKEIEQILRHAQKNSLCIQPYLGSADEEYTVGILRDKDGELIDSIVMKRKLMGLSLLNSRKKNRQVYSISTGYSQGFIIKHKLIQDFCEEVAFKFDSRGPLNIQLRLHKGKPFIFELHPRYSGTTPIRADVGFNEVDILLRNFLFGEKFGRLNYRYNVAVIRAFEHVIVPIVQLIKEKAV